MVHFLADNIISSLGFNTSENFEALKAGQVGIQMIDDKKLYPAPFPASVVSTTVLEQKFQTLNPKANYTRLEKIMILSIADALKKSGNDIQSEKTGIILSTTKGNIDLLENEKAKQFEEDRVLLWRLGEIIGNHFGNPNRVEVLSNACISGVVVINTAASFIENGNIRSFPCSGWPGNMVGIVGRRSTYPGNTFVFVRIFSQNNCPRSLS